MKAEFCSYGLYYTVCGPSFLSKQVAKNKGAALGRPNMLMFDFDLVHYIL